jgi:hypothetical protein
MVTGLIDREVVTLDTIKKYAFRADKTVFWILVIIV